jgi:hypothetical protein
MTKSLRVRCTDEEKCKWTGDRKNRSKRGSLLIKPCPRCGKPVYRPAKLRRAQISAQKRLRASLPPETRKMISSTREIVTDLNPAVMAKTVELIEVGNFPVTAAAAAGIPSTIFGTWMTRGMKEWSKGETTLYSSFYLRVEQSKAIAEVSLVHLGLDKTENNQSTWMGAYRHLESFKRDHWLRTQEVNINSQVKIEHSIDVPPDPPQSHAEWMERKKQREVEAEFEVIEE